MPTIMQISVVVPVYNVSKYLPTCLDSIVNQTYEDLDIIVVDDGSTDDCPRICDEYGQRDTRIRVIHQSNQGLSKARNTGLSLAKGEYVWFVDSDDWIVEDCIGRIAKRLQETQPDMLQIQYEDVYDDSTLNEVPRFFSLEEVCSGKEVMKKGGFPAKESSFFDADKKRTRLQTGPFEKTNQSSSSSSSSSLRGSTRRRISAARRPSTLRISTSRLS